MASAAASRFDLSEFLTGDLGKTEIEKEDDKRNATMMKVATCVITLVAIGALGYFGIHSIIGGIANPSVHQVAGAQFLGGTLSGIGSGLGSYLLLCRSKDWDKGNITDLDKAMLGGLGLMGLGAIGLSITGVAIGSSILGPVIGAISGFGVIAGGKKLLSTNPEREIENRRQKERLLNKNLAEQAEAKEAKEAELKSRAGAEPLDEDSASGE